MRKSDGFFIIEFLVYLCLFSCLSILLMHFVVKSTFALRSHNTKMQRTLHLLTALDLMHHEFINKSSAPKGSWLKTDKDCVIWHSTQQDKDLAFCVKNKKLVRITGHYVPKKKSWSSKTTHLLVNNVEDFSLAYQWDGSGEQLDFITIGLTGMLPDKKNYTLSRSIAIYNRML
jgi:type II secretory pathway component PulJ